MSKSTERVTAGTYTCQLCADGSWECGNPRELCTSDMHAEPKWELMGTISYGIFTARVKDEIVVKVEAMREPSR